MMTIIGIFALIWIAMFVFGLALFKLATIFGLLPGMRFRRRPSNYLTANSIFRISVVGQSMTLTTNHQIPLYTLFDRPANARLDVTPAHDEKIQMIFWEKGQHAQPTANGSQAHVYAACA